MKYRRVLLKLSGEALMGDNGFGISPPVISRIAEELYEVSRMGAQICIVIGGGNIFRGLQKSTELGMERAAADYVGMLATVINCLVLQGVLEKRGMTTRVQTALTMNSIAESYIRRRAMRHLEKGRVVIFGAGTGNPFFTTDTAAALRATEMDCDLLMMAKNGTDGVYDSDPSINSDAEKYETLTCDNVIQKNLKVMDTSAIALCRDNNIPIAVFDFARPGAIRDLVNGMPVGTLVSN